MPRQTTTTCRLLLFGGSGKLGAKMIADYSAEYEVIAPSHKECDIANLTEVRELFRRVVPDVVINVAAIVGAKECEQDKETAWRVNVVGAANIARLCNETNTRLIFTSSSAIFDGKKGIYKETDPPTPGYYYAVTKVAAEQSVGILEKHVIVRLDFFVPEQPLKYNQVLSDHYTSKCTVDRVVDDIRRIMSSSFAGIINIGRPRESLFNILKPYYPSIKPILTKDSALPDFPRDISLDLSLWNGLFK